MKGVASKTRGISVTKRGTSYRYHRGIKEWVPKAVPGTPLVKGSTGSDFRSGRRVESKDTVKITSAVGRERLSGTESKNRIYVKPEENRSSPLEN